MKDVIDALDDIVRAESLRRVVFAGDEVVVPLVRDQLPKALADTVVDFIKMDASAGDREVVERTLDVGRRADACEDTEDVERVLGAQRSGGLGAAGLEETRVSLVNGQVRELLLSADENAIAGANGQAGAEIAEALVHQAYATSARVRFIDDPSLLAPVGGVAALLRFRVGGIAA
ncbi:MAG: hypothetical protein FJZ38_21175 [Candidatus Rokubacteria bacterium]|nr:hypothetical protein [Candidatus Rokubacteria bacterium]